jgi:lipopolysaccharide/colanic/teichoic acid biosynthesis glycosyltransferase
MRSKLKVYTVKPGITGWAQVNGRDDVYYKNKAIMDAEYVKKASIWLDIKVLFLTIKVVFSKKGVV